MKTIIKIGLAVLMIGLFSKLFFKGHPDQKADISELVRGGSLIVDVRTANEFAGGHIENAVNIPYDLVSRDIGSYAPDKDRVLVLYCRSGARASVAKRSLLKLGYSHVVNARTLRAMRAALEQ
jgi:phage shock protein E